MKTFWRTPFVFLLFLVSVFFFQSIAISKTLKQLVFTVKSTPEPDDTMELHVVIVHDGGTEEHDLAIMEGKTDSLTLDIESDNFTIRIIEKDDGGLGKDNELGVLKLNSKSKTGSKNLKYFTEQASMDYTLE